MEVDETPSISSNRIKLGAVVAKYAIVDVRILTNFISSIIRGCGSTQYVDEISVENAAGTLVLGLKDTLGTISRTPMSHPVSFDNRNSKY